MWNSLVIYWFNTSHYITPKCHEIIDIILLSLLTLQIKANPDEDPGYGPEPAEPDPAEDQEILDDGQVKGHWDKRLNSFQKLMFVKVFKEEKVRTDYSYILHSSSSIVILLQ